jgi:hypothetical protein
LKPDLVLEKDKRSITSVDLKDLKQPWLSWCSSHGLTPSEGFRRLIAAVLARNPEGDAETARPPHGYQDARVRLRLKPAENSAMAAVAEREGMTIGRWLTGLVRVHLIGDSQFSRDEIAALTASSRALMALGRNVNQIARHMNEWADKDEMTLSAGRIHCGRNQSAHAHGLSTARCQF